MDQYLVGGHPTEHVFARNTNGDLIEYYWEPQYGCARENLTQYTTIGTAYRIVSDPAVDQYLVGGHPSLHVFARNTNGDLIQYYWEPQYGGAQNLTQYTTIGTAYRIVSDPAVDQYLVGGHPSLHVFARNTNGDLIQYYWEPQYGWRAENLTQYTTIGTAYRIVSDPAVDQYPVGGVPTLHVFARNTNGDLIQYYWEPQYGWRAQISPSTPPSGRPIAS